MMMKQFAVNAMDEVLQEARTLHDNLQGVAKELRHMAQLTKVPVAKELHEMDAKVCEDACAMLRHAAQAAHGGREVEVGDWLLSGWAIDAAGPVSNGRELEQAMTHDFTSTLAYVAWLRTLAGCGRKGAVDNIDACALGRIADRLEALQTEVDKHDAG